MLHIFYDREDGLDHCRICGGAEGDLPMHCPDRVLTIEEREQIAAAQLDFVRGRFVRYVNPAQARINRRSVRIDDAPGGPRYRLIDIDNCIADDEWRISRIDWTAEDANERYRAYHQLAAFDELRNGRLIALGDAERNVYSTARPESFRPLTLEWLKRKGCNPYAVLMRADGDLRPAAEIKHSSLRAFVANNRILAREIRIAFDDHPEVIAMYGAAGIRAQLVAIHQNQRWTEHQEPK